MSETSKIRSLIVDYLDHDFIDWSEVLDIGCGDDPLHPDCETLDSRNISGVTCVRDAMSLPFDSDSLVAVYSSHTLEDLKHTDAALKEWVRVIAPGGLLILYLPDKHWYPNIGHPLANKAHKYDFDIYDILQKFPSLDLSVELAMVRPPINGEYDYENRRKIEYSFLLIGRKNVR